MIAGTGATGCVAPIHVIRRIADNPAIRLEAAHFGESAGFDGKSLVDPQDIPLRITKQLPYGSVLALAISGSKCVEPKTK